MGGVVLMTVTRRTLELDARMECHAMDDATLGQHLVWLRRTLTMADEDGLADWLRQWYALRLEQAEREWDWRLRAERRGGPRVQRGNYRERLDALKARHDIVQVIGRYVSLRKGGREFKGLCPFHAEKTPSFTVNPEKQVWHCFGCGMGGDVITFVEAIETGDFKDAVRWLEQSA